MTTPFESWCEAMGIHPEQFGAWEGYVSQLLAPRNSGGTALFA